MHGPSKTIEFIFDFASPNAYLAYRVLPQILERSGAALKLTPCLLGGLFKATGNQAPMTAFAAVRGKLDYEALETRRFIARHKLSRFRMNPHFPINTLLLMRGAVAADQEGVLTPYVEAVLPAMWEEGLKMDDPAVVDARLKTAGFGDMAKAAGRPEIKARLVELTEAAADRGVFGIPTFFVGREMFFGKERLGQVEEALNDQPSV